MLAHATWVSLSPCLVILIAAVTKPKHCRGGDNSGVPVPAF